MARAGLGGEAVDLGFVVAAIEEGGLSFIWFVVMVVIVYVALLITIAR